MSAIELLEQIRPVWLSRISTHLARGEGTRESFIEQLDRLYELLMQSVETGDPSWLDSIISEWVKATTTTEFETQETNIQKILSNITLETYEIMNELLSVVDSQKVFSLLLPVFTYMSELTTRLETQMHVEHISSELENVTLSLERLEKSKSDFIAVAAHELKTPLTLIEGYTSMIRDVLSGEQNGLDIEVYLQGIDSGSRRLRGIVDDMIDVSMIDNDLLSINYQPIWINRLLEVIQFELYPSSKERNQQLIIKAFPGSEDMIYGDGERLLQAFRNVIANAIKYTPDGGTITVDGRLLPGFIEMTVSDTGIGIEPENHIHIFEKFAHIGDVSLHSSSKIKFKGGGPGLGLPITKGIIDAHGGAIWVESEGQDEIRCPGSTFHILLPIRKQPPDEKIPRLFQAQHESISSS